MTEKLYEYVGFIGRLHYIRDSIRESCQLWKEKHPDGLRGWLKSSLLNFSEHKPQEDEYDKTEYAHLYRRKTRQELIRVSAAVMGIEFSYAAETAFVSPTLLKIGVDHQYMTFVWALSPLVGFFLTPILGSISDRCQLKIGRRRPFIILMSMGVILGLLLVPNGEYLGYIAGDIPPAQNATLRAVIPYRTSALSYERNATWIEDEDELKLGYHPWGIFFTILGTVLLDFDADACQSPARAYLLDVTILEDHARGLSTFTIMAGLGGFFGYATGGINWDITMIGELLGGHVRAVFTLITIVFIICVSCTVTSFKEIPLPLLEIVGAAEDCSKDECTRIIKSTDVSYGALAEKEDEKDSSGDEAEPEKVTVREYQQRFSMAPPPNASLALYLKSIIYMPFSLRILCLTNLFCWMAHVCYSLYFTDFVGEAVFNGDPTGVEGSESRQLYEEGIRFGCWGMSMYSLSCACYSLVIEKFIKRFGAKYVYVGGLLVYSSGMLLMAITKHKVGVILFSWTAGVMYSTLFTMPYLLVAHYHGKKTFEQTSDLCTISSSDNKQVRGLGTDVAIVSSMVFLAQFILSMGIGSVVSITGTTTSVVVAASLLATFGAISATQVMYLDL